MYIFNKISIFFVLTCFILASFILASCSPAVRFTSTDPGNSPAKGYSSVNEKSNSGRKLTEERHTIVHAALSWLGTPYCWGGESRSCTDCSGFMQSIFKTAGINLPRTASKQFRFASKITDGELLPGDLVFFKSGSRINHVGVYSGEGYFIHASSSSGVIKTPLHHSYYRKRVAGYATVLD